MTRKELLDLASEKFLAAVPKGETNPEIWLGLAAIALERSLFQTNAAAIATLEEGFQHSEHGFKVSGSPDAKVWQAILLSHKAERLSGKEAADGLIAAQRALEGVTDSPFSLNARGNREMAAADRRGEGATYQTALQFFESALALRADYLPALLNSARIRIRIARELPSVEARPLIESAVDFCGRALTLRPECYEALTVRAQARILRAEDPRLATPEEWRGLAIADCTRALEVRHDWFPALVQRAAAQRGNARNSHRPDSDTLRDRALADCRAALAIRADFPPALVMAANIVTDSGAAPRIDESYFADRAIGALDDNPHAYAARGRLHLQRGKLDEAAADYSAADSRGRPAAYIKTALGDLSLRRADLAADLEAPLHFLEAAKRAAEAIVIRADYPPAWLLQAKARFGSAQLEPLFERRSALLAEARSLFEKALDLDPIVEARIQLGRCLVEQSSNAPPPEALDAALHAKRIALLEAAQQQFLAATVQDPKSASAYDHLAGVERRLALASDTRDFTAALRSYKTALELRPNYPAALRGIGVISRDQKNLEESAAQLRAALEADPGDPLTVVELAETLRVLPVPFRTDDPESLEYYPHVAEAESLLRPALERGRHRVVLLTVLGKILVSRGNLQEAIQTYATALAIRQQAWMAERLARLAVTLFRETKDPAVMLPHAEAIRAAIATEPDNASAQKALAEFNQAAQAS